MTQITVKYRRTALPISRLLTLLITTTLLLFSAAGCSSQLTASKTVLVGPVSEQQLLQNYPKFNQVYQDYEPSNEEREIYAKLQSDMRVDVYFGTWCHDSVREVPKFLKAIGLASNKVRLIALDMQKTDPQGLAEAADIAYTPTFVISQSGTEIGRVVERATTTINEDIIAIVETSNR
ncbi:thioredoxin family protein [Thalassotalea ponticola]|uniref:thioredoxin family protein n=1 Tax=Thalassotalea ponticola TaxID=1523392 RepID=UPI0025B60B80|nr:thioredoxin family protein [Thalassotalea ponticola]MDN3653933.1 thioredoxin family protein [Thalassotalea ponticola]